MNKPSLLLMLCVVGLNFSAFSQQVSPSEGNLASQVVDKSTPSTSKTEVVYSEGELEQLLAPIALYPDSLLTHILIASTYPLEIIEAERWLKDHKGLNADQVVEKSQNQDWDPSVKALLPFDSVLEKLSNEISWTQQLGDAFLEAEEQVLASIQILRIQADEAGNLDKMENTTVTRVEKTIIIQPSTPEVVYVPYYDTRVVYGPWYWHHYPPVYWVHPIHHYPTHHSPYYWHTPVHVSVGILFGSVHWHSRHIVVHHDTHYYRHHGHNNHHKKHKLHYSKGKKHYTKSGKTFSSRGGDRWQHQPTHRKGVAYQNDRVAKHYKSNRPSAQYSKQLRVQENKFSSTTVHGRETTSRVVKNKTIKKDLNRVTSASNNGNTVNKKTIKMRQDKFKQKMQNKSPTNKEYKAKHSNASNKSQLSQRVSTKTSSRISPSVTNTPKTVTRASKVQSHRGTNINRVKSKSLNLNTKVSANSKTRYVRSSNSVTRNSKNRNTVKRK